MIFLRDAILRILPHPICHDRSVSAIKINLSRANNKSKILSKIMIIDWVENFISGMLENYSLLVSFPPSGCRFDYLIDMKHFH